jgi:hypothetical protein
MIITRRIIITMTNISDNSCIANQKTYFMFKTLPPKIKPFMR